MSSFIRSILYNFWFWIWKLTVVGNREYLYEITSFPNYGADSVIVRFLSSQSNLPLRLKTLFLENVLEADVEYEYTRHELKPVPTTTRGKSLTEIYVLFNDDTLLVFQVVVTDKYREQINAENKAQMLVESLTETERQALIERLRLKH